MKILIVLTSHDKLGYTGKKTGFWKEEFAAPYYVLFDAGVNITLASPKGGQPPIDPKSEEANAKTPSTKRFDEDQELKEKMAETLALNKVNQEDYDGVFYPGGHGPLWDLANDRDSIALIQDFYGHNKPIAFVCHAPVALVSVKDSNGKHLVNNKNVTGFSNKEEAAVNLTNVVPFSLEDQLKNLGAHYSKADNWIAHTQQDGLLITGQNPASSEGVAKLLLGAIQKKLMLSSDLQQTSINYLVH